MLAPYNASFGHRDVKNRRRAVYLVINSNDELAGGLLGGKFNQLSKRVHLWSTTSGSIKGFQSAIDVVYKKYKDHFTAVDVAKIGRCLEDLMETSKVDAAKKAACIAFQPFWTGVTADTDIFVAFFSKLDYWKNRGGTVPRFLKVNGGEGASVPVSRNLFPSPPDHKRKRAQRDDDDDDDEDEDDEEEDDEEDDDGEDEKKRRASKKRKSSSTPAPRQGRPSAGGASSPLRYDLRRSILDMRKRVRADDAAVMGDRAYKEYLFFSAAEIEQTSDDRELKVLYKAAVAETRDAYACTLQTDLCNKHTGALMEKVQAMLM